MRSSTAKDSPAILFVDDEEKARKYFEMACRGDFPVLTAGSVTEALEVLAARAETIGVLLVDQRMPGQSGVELLKRARISWPQVERIMTTAYSDDDAMVAAINEGQIRKYIRKPWDLVQLRADLLEALTLFRVRRERDELLAEKFSVRHHLRHGERLRTLLAVGAGLCHLRHAPAALATWIEHSAQRVPELPRGEHFLELWDTELRDSQDAMLLSRRLCAFDREASCRLQDRFHAHELLPQSMQVPDLQILGNRHLLETLVDNLASLCGGVSRWRAKATKEPRGLRLQIGAGAVPTTAFGPHLDEQGGAVDLIEVYLIAYHHGGRVAVARHGEVTIDLPEDPFVTAMDTFNADWIGERLEWLEERAICDA